MRPIWLNKYEIRYQLEKLGTKMMLRLADLVPKRLAYWIFISIGARHMRNDIVPEVPFTVVLERLHQEIRGSGQNAQ